MISNWWIDLAVLTLMLVSGYLLWRIETSDIRRTPRSPDDLFEIDAEAIGTHPWWHRLYPRRMIRQAGLRPALLGPLYWSGKTVTTLLLVLATFEYFRGSAPIWSLTLAAVIGFLLPDLWLLGRRRRRRTEIANSLSFFINLMVVYLRSGMNLTQAFRQAALYGLPPRNPLAEEVELLTREIEAGRDRDRAFTMLAERTGVPPVRRLASVISVGYRAGSPVSEVLQAQADLLRSRQAQLATELVNRKSMEVMVPMLLICFPVFIVLVLFPAAVQLFDVLRMIGELF